MLYTFSISLLVFVNCTLVGRKIILLPKNKALSFIKVDFRGTTLELIPFAFISFVSETVFSRLLGSCERRLPYEPQNSTLDDTNSCIFKVEAVRCLLHLDWNGL